MTSATPIIRAEAVEVRRWRIALPLAASRPEAEVVSGAPAHCAKATTSAGRERHPDERDEGTGNQRTLIALSNESTSPAVSIKSPETGDSGHRRRHDVPGTAVPSRSASHRRHWRNLGGSPRRHEGCNPSRQTTPTIMPTTMVRGATTRALVGIKLRPKLAKALFKTRRDENAGTDTDDRCDHTDQGSV